MRQQASCWVVSIRVLARASLRVARTVQPWVERAQPWVERAVDVTVCFMGRGASEAWAPLTRHAVAAGMTAGTLALARAFAGPGLAELLEVAAGLAVSAIAISAGISLARRHSSPGRPIRARTLIIATASRMPPQHRRQLPTRALEIACNPSLALARAAEAARHPRALLSTDIVQPLLARAVRLAFHGLLVQRAVGAVPVLGTVLEIANVCERSLESARFVHDFEASAADWCLALAA